MGREWDWDSHSELLVVHGMAWDGAGAGVLGTNSSNPQAERLLPLSADNIYYTLKAQSKKKMGFTP